MLPAVVVTVVATVAFTVVVPLWMEAVKLLPTCVVVVVLPRNTLVRLLVVVLVVVLDPLRC